ncbi:hypothetical protein EDB83DRAFT_2314917 [Lactarius deliciosus]|nr:hypothetical protein EDB83DRAFT_2314917 [Lactarius deliciosus]
MFHTSGSIYRRCDKRRTQTQCFSDGATAESRRDAKSSASPGAPATVAASCGKWQLVQVSDQPQVPTASTPHAPRPCFAATTKVTMVTTIPTVATLASNGRQREWRQQGSSRISESETFWVIKV